MDERLEVARRRVSPGILIFDLAGHLCHINAKASELIATMQNGFGADQSGKSGLPKEIGELFEQVKATSSERETVLFDPTGSLCCAARACFIGALANKPAASHVLILLERVVKKRETDWDTVRQRYDLTRREVEIIRLVWEGMSNRDIGQHLFISESTVKDHLKNVMRKMQVISRSEMIAALH